MKSLHIIVFLQVISFTGLSQANDTVYSQTLQLFFDSYNKRDYAVMRETFGGPLKLIFSEKLLTQLYGTQYEQMGRMTFSDLGWKGSHVKGGMIFERDTTEQIPFGFSFSKKGKIIGLSSSSAKFKYKKQAARTPQSRDIERIDSLVRFKHEAAAFSGCVTVFENDAILYEHCYGRCSYPDGRVLTPDVPFEIASCSKAFTAVAVCLLEQQGKLKYNDLVSSYIPELKIYKGVTIEQLLWHTGGIPDYMELFDKHWDKKRIAKNEDVVALLAKHHPKRYFKPGEKHEYSNTGYVLLATIAERITKMPFENFMKKEVFEKAGMTSAFLYNHRRTENVWRDSYAYGYIRDFRTGLHALPDSLPDYQYVTFLDGITGDGMVNINTRDMLIWDDILRTPGLLTQATIDKIFTSGKTNKGEIIDYGFGWGLNSKEGFERIAEHSGSWPGYTSYVLRFLDRGRTIVIFSNNEYMFIENMAHGIANILE